MPLHITRERLIIVDNYIKLKVTGNIHRLAKKLNLSRTGTYKFLEEMKEEGFPIAYSKRNNRFYYTQKGKMVGYVFVKEAEDTEPEGEKNAREGG